MEKYHKNIKTLADACFITILNEGIVEIYDAYNLAKNQAVILESSKYAWFKINGHNDNVF